MLDYEFIVDLDYTTSPINPTTGNPQSIIITYMNGKKESVDYESKWKEIAQRLLEQEEISIILTKLKGMSPWANLYVMDCIDEHL